MRGGAPLGWGCGIGWVGGAVHAVLCGGGLGDRRRVQAARVHSVPARPGRDQIPRAVVRVHPLAAAAAQPRADLQGGSTAGQGPAKLLGGVLQLLWAGSVHLPGNGGGMLPQDLRAGRRGESLRFPDHLCHH
jgi:hypothetical protein